MRDGNQQEENYKLCTKVEHLHTKTESSIYFGSKLIFLSSYAELENEIIPLNQVVKSNYTR